MASLRLIGVLCTALIFVLGACASHPRTVIKSLNSPVSSSMAGKHIDFVTSFHYLGTVDDPTDTKPSGFKRDHQIAKSVVSSVLSPYNNGAIRVVDSAQAITAPYVCEMKIHQFVAWKEILYALLPSPHSSNESICVTAELKKKGRSLSEYSECGFSKESGFWAWSGPQLPSMDELRTFVTKKVVYQVLSDVAQN